MQFGGSSQWSPSACLLPGTLVWTSCSPWKVSGACLPSSTSERLEGGGVILPKYLAFHQSVSERVARTLELPLRGQGQNRPESLLPPEKAPTFFPKTL